MNGSALGGASTYAGTVARSVIPTRNKDPNLKVSSLQASHDLEQTDMTDPAGGANLEAAAESERFDDISITLYWLTVLLIVALFASAWAREAVDHDTRLASALMTVHRTTGVVTWIVRWVRLVWRHRFAYLPPYPESVPKLQQWAAKANEYGLYVLLLTQPISRIGNVLFRGHSLKLLVWEIPAVFDANPTIRDMFVEVHEFGGKALRKKSDLQCQSRCSPAPTR
jgi:cytochrome b561